MALGHFPTLLAALPPAKQRSVALSVVRALEGGTDCIDDAAHVDMLFRFLQPLVLAGSGDVVIVRALLPVALPCQHGAERSRLRLSARRRFPVPASLRLGPGPVRIALPPRGAVRRCEARCAAKGAHGSASAGTLPRRLRHAA